MQIFSDHVGREHHDVHVLVKALARAQVADAFVRELHRAHHLDHIEGRPANVVAEHLQVVQLGDRIRLHTQIVLLQFLLDLLDTLRDVLVLVVFVVADAAHQIGLVLVEQPLEIAFHLS